MKPEEMPIYKIRKEESVRDILETLLESHTESIMGNVRANHHGTQSDRRLSNIANENFDNALEEAVCNLVKL